MQPSSEPTSTAPGLEKRGFERSDRPLARRIDDQDSRHRVDALGNPLAVSLTGGHVHDVTQAQVLTQKIEPAALLADKGYDSDGFIEHLEVRRIKPVTFRRGQIARRRASATSRSIASATSWNVSSTSSSTFAPSQPATDRKSTRLNS